VRPKRRLRWAAIPVGIAAAVILAGCTTTELNGYLPGFQDDGVQATNHTEMISGLWVNSWIVLLVVGVITWGLTLFAMFAYRRRKGQTGLPVQLRYNMPIEIFYTLVPFVLVLGLFAFTARDQTILETQYDDPDVSIVAIGKQWAWDFQYNGDEEDKSDAVWTMGVQATPAANGDVDQASLPTLVLPVNKTVKIDLRSRDVIHSFWVIDFLYKKDMIPGRDNEWSFVPTREGTYAGKCAELCGEYHSAMLFNVEVVSEAEYEDYLDTLRDAGQTGDITQYDRNSNLPGTGGNTADVVGTEEG
jgi:cytochrome c oxidase subunit 2